MYRTVFEIIGGVTRRSGIIAASLASAILALGTLPAAAQFATPQTMPQGGQQQAPQSAPQQAPKPQPQQQAPRPAPQATPRPAAPAQQARPAEPAPIAPPPARSVEGIAAVVNDDIISTSDLTARLQLALVSSGLPSTAETRQRLTPQVLRGLVDERLQLQEATRSNISVGEKEIGDAFARVAEQNRMDRDQLEKMLASQGVPRSTLESQIRSTIAWGKLVQRRLRPSIEIGQDEIDAVLQRIQANAGKPEYLTAEIFLAVDTPDREDEIKRLADRLVEQIGQGASFPAVARQFSQSAGASNGGDLGWVQQGQLPDELDTVLRELRPGQASRPIRSLTGYHILLLRDQRTTGGTLPPRDQVMASLGQERLDMLQRRLLRDLRRDAFVDLRI
ncbi:peptidylprolyl isomerase [Skermanella stibiiresistens SB22]|uniref:Parvulin-like PPIase n=1 Tax=Skermanella stibiiresistens SB22 TaxID=1385369 RepID=W9H1B4_9PROT|nr:peptidylprolyl isomerase [Skermanella stibiiresistens]EWY39970.1 peptidylprolyl isomerase [Skermanella stibiiresistens SB22]